MENISKFTYAGFKRIKMTINKTFSPCDMIKLAEKHYGSSSGCA